MPYQTQIRKQLGCGKLQNVVFTRIVSIFIMFWQQSRFGHSLSLFFLFYEIHGLSMYRGWLTFYILIWTKILHLALKNQKTVNGMFKSYKKQKFRCFSFLGQKQFFMLKRKSKLLKKKILEKVLRGLISQVTFSIRHNIKECFEEMLCKFSLKVWKLSCIR